MKKIFVLLLFLSSCAVGPPLTVRFDEPVIRVFEGLSGTQDELYVKANEWMVAVFNNAASVIQFSDKEAGVLIGKCLLAGEDLRRGDVYSKLPDTRVFALIDIRVKDGKARVSVMADDWEVGQSDIYGPMGLSKEYVTESIKLLINDMGEALGKEVDF